MIALVFGAGGGLGEAVAAIYRAEGYEVWTVNRQACDFLSVDSVQAFLARTLADAREIAVCVFAAGHCQAGLLRDLPVEALGESLRVNFLAPVELTLGLARAGLCRRFVFVLSGAGELLLPGLAPYALSKRALRDFLYFAELERSLPGVTFLQVWPGPLATGFNRKAKRFGGFVLPSAGRPRAADLIARRLFVAEQAGRSRLVVSPLALFLGKMQALLGRLGAYLLIGMRRWAPRQ